MVKFNLISSSLLFPLLLVSFGGIVKDTDGRAIPYVYIYNHSRNNWNLTDADGYFLLPPATSPGDSLEISRMGYHSKLITLPIDHNNLFITLKSNPVNFPAITATGKKSNYGEQVNYIQKRVHGNSVGYDFLKRISGLQLKRYGGPAGISTLSISGNPASYIKVKFEDIDITSPQNGETDLSQIPLPLIGYAKYDQMGNGSGSGDGIVSLKSWEECSQFTVKTGSFGNKSINGSIMFQVNSITASLLSGYFIHDGNYPVTWRDNTFVRTNNRFVQKFAAFKIKGILSLKFYYQFHFFNSNQDRGIPGQVWSQDDTAQRNDYLRGSSAALGWVSNRGYGKFLLAYRGSYEHYTDTFPTIDSEHSLSAWQASLFQKFQLTKILGSEFRVELKEEEITSSDAGDHLRSTMGIRASFPFEIAPFLSLNPSISHNLSSGLYSETTHHTWISIHLKNSFISSMEYVYSTHFRYPSFNDLYWSPGGNLNLKPEKGNNQSLKVTKAFSSQCKLSVERFQMDNNDLIQWTPSGSQWAPENILHSTNSGWRVYVEWSLNFVPLEGYINSSLVKTENLTPGDHYKKSLRYAPTGTASASVRWTPGQFGFEVQSHFTGERIAMYSWPEDVTLPSYSVTNLSLSYTLQNWFKRIKLISILSADNITNATYETIRGYPEPGRSINFTLQFMFN